MRPRAWLAVGAGLLSSIGACGPEPTGAGDRAEAQRATTATAGAETTDFLADPAFTPPLPQTEPRTGEPSGAVITSSADQARRLALRIVDALRAGDTAALERAFSDPVLRVRADRYILRGRLASQCLRAAAPLGWHADADPTQLIDAGAIVVTPLRDDDETQGLPPGLERGDLRVEVPLTQPVRGRRRQLPCLSHIYVRTGAEPTVIAID